MKIGKKRINKQSLPFLIAEVGQHHEGSLSLAHAYIDAVASTGFDAIKFQTHIAEAESTYDEKFRVPISNEFKTRLDYWKKMEFTENEWGELSRHAKDKNLIFLSSPFSLEAFNLLSKLGIDAWKISSGEFFNPEIIEACMSSKKPILLSTGMSFFDEIDEIVKRFKNLGKEFLLFQCTTQYPSSLSNVGLNIVEDFRKKYDCLVGLSDHSGTIFPSLVAFSQMINALEVHVIFDKGMTSPDSSSSLTMKDLKFLRKARDSIFEINKGKVDKDKLVKTLVKNRDLFSRSLALKKRISKGEKILRENITLKKPGTGIKFSNLNQVVNKVANKDLSQNWLLEKGDFEES